MICQFETETTSDPKTYKCERIRVSKQHLSCRARTQQPSHAKNWHHNVSDAYFSSALDCTAEKIEAGVFTVRIPRSHITSLEWGVGQAGHMHSWCTTGLRVWHEPGPMSCFQRTLARSNHLSAICANSKAQATWKLSVHDCVTALLIYYMYWMGKDTKHRKLKPQSSVYIMVLVAKVIWFKHLFLCQYIWLYSLLFLIELFCKVKFIMCWMLPFI